MAELSRSFAINICAYAVMSNHYHLALHVDAAQARDWSNQNHKTPISNHKRNSPPTIRLPYHKTTSAVPIPEKEPDYRKLNQKAGFAELFQKHSPDRDSADIMIATQAPHPKS